MSSKPALSPTVRYAEPEYWDSRYQREPSRFEWFFGHTALRRVIRAYVSKKRPVLHVGCGTSNLQEGMAQSGYTIVNTDISEVVINQMKERHAKYPNMSYLVSDCRNMPEFMDCQFGHVIDKGTVDALLCCKHGTDNVMKMLLEIYRVLQPGGSFLLITLGDPARRLPLLLDSRLQWQVSLLLLPKITAACQAYVDGKPINDTVQPIDTDGPYEVLDRDTIVGVPVDVQYDKFFFAYVCTKPRLQLPLAHGQRAQLPASWVAGSKEILQKLQKEMGLPEDVLLKGRRKRTVHVPASAAGSASNLHALLQSPNPLGSSTASCNSVTSLPELPQAQALLGHSRPDTPASGRQQQQQQPAELPPSGMRNLQPHSGLPRPHSSPDLSVHFNSASAGPAATAAAVDLASGRHRPPRHAESLSAFQPEHKTDLPVTLAQSAQSAIAASLQAPVADSGLSQISEEQQQQEHEVRAESTGAGGTCSSTSHSSTGVVRFVEDYDAATEAAHCLEPPLGSWQSAAISPSATAAAAEGSARGAIPSLSLKPQLACRPATATPVAATPGPTTRDAADDSLMGSSGNGAASILRIRRFSTESRTVPMTAAQQQLVLLRLHQEQHSEQAADGLILHDVAATEACGGSGAAAAAAAIATAVWGRTRPSRDRRLSGVSAVSNLSLITNSSIDEEAVQDDAELGAGDAMVSARTTSGDMVSSILQKDGTAAGG